MMLCGLASAFLVSWMNASGQTTGAVVPDFIEEERLATQVRLRTQVRLTTEVRSTTAQRAQIKTFQYCPFPTELHLEI